MLASAKDHFGETWLLPLSLYLSDCLHPAPDVNPETVPAWSVPGARRTFNRTTKKGLQIFGECWRWTGPCNSSLDDSMPHALMCACCRLHRKIVSMTSSFAPMAGARREGRLRVCLLARAIACCAAAILGRLLCAHRHLDEVEDDDELDFSLPPSRHRAADSKACCPVGPCVIS